MLVGAAIAVGEQPIKGLVCPEAGARMSLAEALTNLVFAPITDLRDVKCSGNWMWAAKLPGEGARLSKAADALCAAMGVLGVAIDGGKDSLSMAAQVGNEIVKAPGTLVISAYAPCTDVTKVVTPDLKGNGAEPTNLVYVRFGSDLTKNRLGGSALAQCLKQVGDVSADIDDLPLFDKAFRTLQQLINDGHVLAGHDVSDGGLVTAILEMAFAGNRSINVNINSATDAVKTLFAEEAGVVLEVATYAVQTVAEAFTTHQIPVQIIGFTAAEFGPDASVQIIVNDEYVVEEKLISLRSMWEETSTRLELLQTAHSHVDQQTAFLNTATTVNYKIDFDFGASEKVGAGPYKVAILREEGSNGDREMAAAFMLAGFETFDVTMTDIMEDVSILEHFNGIAFVGGFSYADVLGSSKGWASTIRFNPNVLEAFSKFKARPDTFSFGVCNGCQLMGLLGWIGSKDDEPQVFLDENACGRFQSSFCTVRIEKNPAIMLQGMEKSVLGTWTSHGEGRFTYRNPNFLDELKASNLVCIRYVDGNGEPTMNYPENPNGSEFSVAGVCSEDGRHLAMMPHPTARSSPGSGRTTPRNSAPTPPPPRPGSRFSATLTSGSRD
ncbi:hypothetical protein L596_023335 [Steinernema carpocapsae]|uniref:Uncharacterized protein n=1 Tax=Steinernema carpocapsae TaxID=34508 RepID=A0A4U5MDD6_STECR|nr:hypothetical protein L596_023335 [Steinernema carpocapsae]